MPRTRRQPGAGTIRKYLSSLAEFLERGLALVLAQKVQELLVVLRLHVEHPRHDLVVAARPLQAAADDLAHGGAANLALQQHRIDRRPERLALVRDPLVELIGDRPAPLAERGRAFRLGAEPPPP